MLKSCRIKKFINKMGNREAITAYLLLIPAVVFFGLFLYMPIIGSFVISFFNYDILAETQPFVGLENYTRLIAEPQTFEVLKNTLYYVVVTVTVTLLISLILSILINRVKVFSVYFKITYFMPTVVSLIVISQVWLWLYDYKFGLINYILSLTGLSPRNWLGDKNLAMPAVMAMQIWREIGYDTIILLAGLQNIPDQYYEAARVDGASGFQLSWYMTLPLLKPIILVVLITTTISAFQVFTPIYAMTQGGPMNATRVLVYHLYQKGFLFSRLGQACALAYMLLIIILAFSLLHLRLFRKEY